MRDLMALPLTRRPKHSKFRLFGARLGARSGFALVVALALMILLAVLAVGLMGLASVELRKSGQGESRSFAMANARMGLLLALGQLQNDLGDDRRATADASLLASSKNPYAVGVWNGWSPDIASRSGTPGGTRISYTTPKSQTGFRSWLVSSANPALVRQLAWHASEPSGIAMFSQKNSGFELKAERIPVSAGVNSGAVAWAVTQENTKAKINIGTDETKRISAQDQVQTPSRPNLFNSSVFKHPESDWPKRAVAITGLPQARLDSAYGVTAQGLAQAARDYTAHAFSLLTNPVKGGLKVDLSTGFDLEDADFSNNTWSTPSGSVANPFRATAPREYKGQKPLFQPVVNDPQVRIFMDFAPASVNHKFEVNGVPTFDTLRSYYRTYRHLYNSGLGGTTGFERPYSHIATQTQVTGRPYGKKSQPALAPVLDRVYYLMSIYAKADGTMGVLLTPYVTIWNPHNVEIETEGVVVYPWIDFAVKWNYTVTKADGGKVGVFSNSLARVVGEGYGGHGRSTRPYFYLHLTQTGAPVAAGTRTISPAIHLNPGEVRVFCLADQERMVRDLETMQGPAARTWKMKAVNNASDIVNSTKSGIFLNFDKALPGTTFQNKYLLKPGDVIDANTIEFNRGTFNHICCAADSWQIKNPGVELMLEARPASGNLPALPAEPNLAFLGEVHSLPVSSGIMDTLTYPSFPFELVRENPRMVGGLLTYHRTADSGTTGAGATLANSDLMFTTNPRQPFINSYLSGGKFQTAPHYETLMVAGTTLASLAMETTPDGKDAYYGRSHSVSKGSSNPVCFEIPRSPTLSLAALQHCDIATTPYSVASQIGNSWAPPYMPVNSASKKLDAVDLTGAAIGPSGLGMYDYSYLANETLFDGFYFSGAAPEFGSRRNASGSPAVWDSDQITETQTTDQVLASFFANPVAFPLRNPRMFPYSARMSLPSLKDRLAGASKCVRLSGHLMVNGGFNINSTSEEAWIAMLSSLRGASPASSGKTAMSRFRHVLTGTPVNMTENNGWTGFRSLTDTEIKTLAKNLVVEIKARGPFLSLGEFVNRRVSSDTGKNLAGAIQSAIDKSGLNDAFKCSNFATGSYSNPENLPAPDTGTNTPGWLSQADVLHGLAPFISSRSDTFVIRSLGEARSADGRVLASVRLEAVVQRVPDWVDPADDAATAQASLKSVINKTFGRRFQVVSIREIRPDPAGDPEG